MQSLFDCLNKIQELLQQIHDITENQTTILTSSIQADEEVVDDTLSMIEEMVDYKDELINLLTEAERTFQGIYNDHREEIIQSKQMKLVKSEVEKVLKLKDEITKKEQKNVLLLQGQSRKRIERVKVTPNKNQVVAAYRKQQNKS